MMKNRNEDPVDMIRISASAGVSTGSDAVRRGVSVLPLVLFTAFASVALFLILEGIASVVLSGPGRPVAERRHTEYDKDLGWVNLPNVFEENMYGPGKYLRTNSQRFRNNADFAVQVPTGKIRVIASGDSFTLGYGVDNDHTWSQQLARSDGRLEVVNMGQGGYGIDQAYLWYKRDGAKLDHDILIFAFTTMDFNRMQTDSFFGYGKPVLAIENGMIVTRNQPVPKYQSSSAQMTHIRGIINGLLSTRLLQQALLCGRALFVSDETRQVVAKVVDDIVAKTRAKNAIPVLVYLPTEMDHVGNTAEPWRRHMAQVASAENVLFFDLIDDFRSLPAGEIKSLFLGEGVVDYAGAAGHYSEKGNDVVAGLIRERFMANPRIASRLASARPF
ncbi:MAG: SGNH/GDSL hydrolase family protein [Syntrophales bacterium]|jgi:hypothetical protein